VKCGPVRWPPVTEGQADGRDHRRILVRAHFASFPNSRIVFRRRGCLAPCGWTHAFRSDESGGPSRNKPGRRSRFAEISGIRKNEVILQARWKYTRAEPRGDKSVPHHKLSFHHCMAALDTALADLTSRLTVEQIAPLRPLILENNDIVMKEMERRGPPPFDPQILAALGDGITVSDYRPGQVIIRKDSGEAVFYIQKGRVKLTAASKLGKQAVIGVLGQAAFLAKHA